MGCRHDYASYRILFAIFGIGSGMLDCDFGDKFLQKWRWILVFKASTRLPRKVLCTITSKQHKCPFGFYKEYSARESRLCTLNGCRNWKCC